MAVKASVMWQPELESIDRAPLERLVVERMRATLARVLAEPAWARRLRGVHPEDVVRVEDWRGPPVLPKGGGRGAGPPGLGGARGGGGCRGPRGRGGARRPLPNHPI